MGYDEMAELWAEKRRRWLEQLEKKDSNMITCRNCGEEPAWAKDVFCIRCRDRLHAQVALFLSQH